MNRTFKIILVLLIVCIATIILLNAQERRKTELMKKSLKGEIVFAYGKDELYALTLPTMELNNILKERKFKIVFPSYPSWSPSGQKIALSQEGKDYSAGVLTIINLKNATTKEFRNINLDCDHSSWSPNGAYIAFLGRPIEAKKGDYKLYVFTMKDMKYRMLSDMHAGPYRPTWSSDSSKIIFSTADNRIFTLDVNSNKAPELVIPFGVSPAWSPDGNYIVYRARYSVFLYDLNQKTERELISNLGFSDIRDFAWSPDSQYILYKKLSESFSPIEIISRDGKTKIALKEFGNLRGFSWKY